MKPKRGYTFDNFFLYDGNRVAYLAAQKVLQFPGELFNPFYVYGGTGLGKTHLLWAIHSELSRKGTTLFFTGSEFEQWVSSRPDTNVMLIIDDFQTMTERCHEILLSVIDAALANNRQLCFSGALPPREMKSINSKLISRLEGGLTCDIQPPKELFLVDMIKKKSEESGIILPDEIALELAQLSSGSIRTIEGMINRLVAYSSLGQFSLDLGTIRLILKEFYPRGVFSPVSSLIEELKNNATEVLRDVSEQGNPREEFKEKIYIWEMKGFDISSLKPFIDADIDALVREYGIFIKKIETLIELQKEFGALDTSQSPSEALKIETMLFSPERIDEIRVLINSIRSRSAVPLHTFADFLVGNPNRTAYELYKNTVLPNLGKQFNPMIILGGRGKGKTHLLAAIYFDLSDQAKTPVYIDLRLAAGQGFHTDSSHGVLLVDNFTAIMAEAAPLRESLFSTLRECLKRDCQVIIASESLPTELDLTSSEREQFELGIEVRLESPDEELARRYIAAHSSSTVPPATLPGFSSFYEIDAFLASLPATPEPMSVVKETIVPTAGSGGTEEPEPLPSSTELPIATVVAEPQDVVPLGLPGEDEKKAEPPSAMAATPAETIVPTAEPIPSGSQTSEPPSIEPVTAEPAPTAVPSDKVPLPLPVKPFESLKEQRIMLPDFINELIEENF